MRPWSRHVLGERPARNGQPRQHRWASPGRRFARAVSTSASPGRQPSRDAEPGVAREAATICSAKTAFLRPRVQLIEDPRRHRAARQPGDLTVYLWAGQRAQPYLLHARRGVHLRQPVRHVRSHRRLVTSSTRPPESIPEHILLGLIREGDGVAAEVLVKLGADLNRVRQQVVELLSAQRAQPGHEPAWEGTPVTEVRARLDVIEGRVAAVEQRMGTGPDTSDLDDQIDRVRRERDDAVAVQEYELAASLRDQEKDLLASRSARQERWAAGHPALPVLAERYEQLADEIERLCALLRAHGIDPQEPGGRA